MSKCDICGPLFIGKCPHKLSKLEMVEAVAAWTIDDFGHDCQALLEAESRALQDICDAYLELLKIFNACGTMEAYNKLKGGS